MSLALLREAHAARQCGKAVIVGAVFVTPLIASSICGLENLPCRGRVSDKFNQRIPFGLTRQAPVARAHCLRFVPRITTAVQGKVFHFSADAVDRFIIKVFGHPNSIANFHGLVSLAVARVFESIRGSIEFAAGTV